MKIGVEKREFEFHLTDEERHSLRLKGEAQKLTLIDRRRPTEEDWRNLLDARQTQMSFVKPRSKARKDDEAKPS